MKLIMPARVIPSTNQRNCKRCRLPAGRDSGSATLAAYAIFKDTGTAQIGYASDAPPHRGAKRIRAAFTKR